MKASETLNTPERLALYRRVAYLAGAGMKQSDIAARLSVNQSTVSKRLNEAEDLGFVCLLPTLPAKELEEIRHQFSATAALELAVRSILPKVAHVCVCPRPFHRFAALHLDLVLEEALSESGHLSSACVAWGETAQQTLAALEPYARHTKLKAWDRVKCVAARGDFLMADVPPEQSATTNALILSRILNGPHAGVRGGDPAVIPLTGIPAVVPRGVGLNTKQAETTVRDYYREVLRICFDAWDDLDLIVLSVGGAVPSNAAPQSFLGERQFRQPLAATVTQYLAGDLAGIWLTKADEQVPDDVRASMEDNQSLWLGLEKAHVSACAAKARKWRDAEGSVGPPGVVVLAGGTEETALSVLTGKAICIRAAAREGLITRVICDEAVAQAIVG